MTVIDKGLSDFTSEGEQEMQSRQVAGGVEVLREVGSVLRLSEADAAVLADREDDAETTILNMGPQHPSTHGVLRLMIELDGETVIRVKPVVGYLHTGMEKTGEELTYVQGATNNTRMDYLAPISNEMAYCLAAEKLLEVELPERAIWIRTLLAEVNRIISRFIQP